MVYEFELITGFNSPNKNTKTTQNNKLAMREFKKGDFFVGERASLSKDAGVGDVYVNQEGWMIPVSKLKRKNKEKFANFTEYKAEKNTLKPGELPEEIQKKVNEIAKKNFSLNVGKEIKKNFSNVVLYAGIGFGFAAFTDRNVYKWALGGLFVGLLASALKKPAAEKAVEKAEKEETEDKK